MKCSKCGTLLEEGSNVCPNCQNIMSLEDIEEIEELDDSSLISENMAPPSLEVNEENLTSGVVDINTNGNEALYEEDPEKKEIVDLDETPNQNSNVDIAIPSVSEVVENADAVTGVVSEADKEDKKKKLKFNFNLKGSVPALYMIIASFATLVVGMLLGKSLFSTAYISAGCNASNINTKVVADGKNNETYLNGLTFKVPSAYLYDKRDNGLVIYDKNGKVRMYARLDYGIYDDLAISKTSIKESLKAKKIIVNTIEERKINDSNYLVLEVSTTDNQNRLLAFRKFDDARVFYMEIIDTTNNYNREALNVLDDVINNVKETEGATIESVGLYDVSKLLISTAKEYKALISNEK